MDTIELYGVEHDHVEWPVIDHIQRQYSGRSTNSNGDFNTDIRTSDTMILYARVPGNTKYVVYPYVGDNARWFVRVLNYETNQPVKNTSLDLDVWYHIYIDLTV